MNLVCVYRVYFDGMRFVADDYPTPISKQTGRELEATFCSRDGASAAVALWNKKEVLDTVKVCKDCGKHYILSESERDWFTEKGLKPPVRCKECRDKRKEKRNER